MTSKDEGNKLGDEKEERGPRKRRKEIKEEK